MYCEFLDSPVFLKWTPCLRHPSSRLLFRVIGWTPSAWAAREVVSQQALLKWIKNQTKGIAFALHASQTNLSSRSPIVSHLCVSLAFVSRSRSSLICDAERFELFGMAMYVPFIFGCLENLLCLKRGIQEKGLNIPLVRTISNKLYYHLLGASHIKLIMADHTKQSLGHSTGLMKI